MRPIIGIGLFCATAVSCTLAFAAATVNVSYVAPETFADFGFAPSESKANREALARHFVQLGKRRLADGQTLTIEVLDVDLAGSARPWHTVAGSEVRVVRDADWTRIHVRYTLQGGGQPTRSGDEWISGIGQSLDPLWRCGSDVLGRERRMLDDWYLRRFGKNASAP